MTINIALKGAMSHYLKIFLKSQIKKIYIFPSTEFQK